MRRLPSILVAALALAAPLAHADDSREIVRVHYRDRATLDELGGHFGHVMVDRESATARVEVDAGGRKWLEQHGLQIEVEHVAHAKNIREYSCYRTVEE